MSNGPGIGPDQLEGLRARVSAEIKNELNFKAVVTLVPPESIERTQMGKARRVIRDY